MKTSRLVKFQWAVIVVLGVGFAVVTYIALHRADAIDKARSDQQGNIDSLRRQLKEAKLTVTPAPAQLPEASSNLATPTPTTSPKPTTTPKSTSSNL